MCGREGWSRVLKILGGCGDFLLVCVRRVRKSGDGRGLGGRELRGGWLGVDLGGGQEVLDGDGVLSDEAWCTGVGSGIGNSCMCKRHWKIGIYYLISDTCLRKICMKIGMNHLKVTKHFPTPTLCLSLPVYLISGFVKFGVVQDWVCSHVVLEASKRSSHGNYNASCLSPCLCPDNHTQFHHQAL